MFASKNSSLILAGFLCGAAALSGCGASRGTCAIAAGTVIAVSRTGGTGGCPAAVVAGVTSLNGTETFTPMKGISCFGGPSTLNLTINFSSQDASHTSCVGNDVVNFADLATDGGTGTDTMTITCTGSAACIEMFAVAFAPH